MVTHKQRIFYFVNLYEIDKNAVEKKRSQFISKSDRIFVNLIFVDKQNIHFS